MKRILLLVLGLFFSVNLYSQTEKHPVIKYYSKLMITGTTHPETDIRIDTDGDDKPDHDFESDDIGNFSFTFKTPLKDKSTISVWSYDKSGKESNKVYIIIPTDLETRNFLENEAKEIENQKKEQELRLALIKQQKLELEKNEKAEEEKQTKKEIETLKAKGYEINKSNEITDKDLKKEIDTINKINVINSTLKNTTLTYKATMFNTNFSIPIARFNLVRHDNSKQGDVILFNSIGAGIGLSSGRYEVTRDDTGDIVDEEFSNTFGLHFGVLFSSGTGEDKKNVFAPVLNLGMLDFQLGVGYELGSLATNQRPFFYTVSYAIPLHKLVKKAFRIYWQAPTPIKVKKRSYK